MEDVYANSESTYKVNSEVRGLKMPGGSSFRSLVLRFLKATINEIDQIFRVDSIPCPVAYHH